VIDIGIEALLIMDKTGVPLLFQKLNPKKKKSKYRQKLDLK